MAHDPTGDAVPHATTPTSPWRGALGSAVLGIQAWVVLGLWPASHAAEFSRLQHLVLWLPLGVLGVGVWLGHRGHPGSLVGLLVVFPPCLLGSLVLQPEWLNQAAFGPGMLLLACGSLVAYGWSASQLDLRRQGTPPPPLVRRLPAGETAPQRKFWRPRLGAATLVIACIGSVVLAVIAPSRGGWETLQVGWEDAAREGGVLTAVVASALAASVLALCVGPALRARHEPEPSRGRARRVTWRIALAALGAFTYAVITQR